MNCRAFEMNVLALARNELIDVTRRETNLAHAVNCVRCADRLTGERALIVGVHAVVAELAETQTPAHVGAALLAAFREQAATVTADRIIPMPLKTARHWRLEAVAAALLIMVSLVAVLWLYSRSPIRKLAGLMVPPSPITAPELTRPEIEQDRQTDGDPPTTLPTRARHRAFRQRAHATEEVTEFFPLMEGIDLDSLEAVQAVRVELPASALMDLGLRVDPETTTRPVKADVLLGLDGMARAIRFVR